jgi:hypothetical protein
VNHVGNGGAAWHLQFAKNIAQMAVDGAMANHESFGYFAVCLAFCYQA